MTLKLIVDIDVRRMYSKERCVRSNWDRQNNYINNRVFIYSDFELVKVHTKNQI